MKFSLPFLRGVLNEKSAKFFENSSVLDYTYM